MLVDVLGDGMKDAILMCNPGHYAKPVGNRGLRSTSQKDPQLDSRQVFCLGVKARDYTYIIPAVPAFAFI